MMISSMRISVKTKEMLDGLKIRAEESHEDVIVRLGREHRLTQKILEGKFGSQDVINEFAKVVSERIRNMSS